MLLFYQVATRLSITTLCRLHYALSCIYQIVVTIELHSVSFYRQLNKGSPFIVKTQKPWIDIGIQLPEKYKENFDGSSEGPSS